MTPYESYMKQASLVRQMLHGAKPITAEEGRYASKVLARYSQYAAKKRGLGPVATISHFGSDPKLGNNVAMSVSPMLGPLPIGMTAMTGEARHAAHPANPYLGQSAGHLQMLLTNPLAMRQGLGNKMVDVSHDIGHALGLSKVDFTAVNQQSVPKMGERLGFTPSHAKSGPKDFGEWLHRTATKAQTFGMMDGESQLWTKHLQDSPAVARDKAIAATKRANSDDEATPFNGLTALGAGAGGLAGAALAGHAGHIADQHIASYAYDLKKGLGAHPNLQAMGRMVAPAKTPRLTGRAAVMGGLAGAALGAVPGMLHGLSKEYDQVTRS